MGDEKKTKKEKKKKTEKVVFVVEYNISMHCNACERTVAKAISKIKGVEKFMTDTTRHKVIVTGKIDPQKVLKKLRKKTGKRVEIETKKEENSKDTDEEQSLLISMRMQSCCEDSVLYSMFSDENANACSIM